MSAQEYNTVRQTPVSQLGRLPDALFAQYLQGCPVQLRARLARARWAQ